MIFSERRLAALKAANPDLWRQMEELIGVSDIGARMRELAQERDELTDRLAALQAVALSEEIVEC